MELLVIIIVLALIFDYINGFHDAANSIATIVSTKVLTPFQAVIWDLERRCRPSPFSYLKCRKHPKMQIVVL